MLMGNLFMYYVVPQDYQHQMENLEH
jgi:hypothetical protein